MNTPLDPFEDAGEGSSGCSALVHIRIQQRNGRKTLTTVEGLSSEFDLPKIMRAWRKNFCCNGWLVTDDRLGQVVQLQGDQRKKVSLFLLEEGICPSSKLLRIHGF